MLHRQLARRERRKAKIRAKIRGTGLRPRLSVFRSNRHIFAQLIDDSQGKTVVAASDCEPDFTVDRQGLPRTAVAAEVGRILAERAKQQNYRQLVFDRSGYKYHGRIKALAEAVRKGGVKI